MRPPVKYLVSASRRTDMLAGQQQRLIAALEGKLPAAPTLSADKIHTLLVSTKDFQPLLDMPALRIAAGKCGQVCINLTITGLGGTALEPKVPRADALLRRIDDLVEFVGDPKRITWCYKPILSWNGLRNDSIDVFRQIAERMSAAGISRVMALFFRQYGHARVIPEKIEPDARKWFAEEMDDTATRLGMALSVCHIPGFHQMKCVDVDYFIGVHPEKDASIREYYLSYPKPKSHCRDVIWDIGWYKPLCRHGCLYCYGLSEREATNT